MGAWTDHLTADGVAIDAEIQQRNDEVLAVQGQLGTALDENLLLRQKLAEYETPPPVPEPIPDPVTTMWVGTSLYTPAGETMAEGFARRTQEWGAEPEMVRYFFSGMPNGWPQFGKAATVVSFKPPNNDVKGFAAGKYDAQVVAWLNSLPRDTQTRRIAIYHEREDNIEAGQFTFADAKAMDARLNSLIDAANARNGTRLTFGLILMAWTLETASGRKLANYLPTDFKYDWMGWDAYSGNSYSLDQPDFKRTKSNFTACRDATKAHGAKNWFICETGTSNKGHDLAEYDTLQAQWITGAAQIARDLGCKGFMYWDSITGVGQQNNYTIQGPKAKAAMGAEIKRA